MQLLTLCRLQSSLTFLGAREQYQRFAGYGRIAIDPGCSSFVRLRLLPVLSGFGVGFDNLRIRDLDVILG